MFRRKEEGLFDNNAEGNNELVEGHGDSVAADEVQAAAPQAAVAHSTAAVAPVATTASTNFSANNASSTVRPNTAPPTANSFRPNVAPAARLPEVKVATTVVAASEKAKSGKRVLTVGNDILLKGEIATCDRLVIDGQVDATLNDVHTVEISECGSFKGSAQIEDAEIRGLFEGDLTVRGRLVIYSTGKVRGKISYGEIEIERGGEFTGEIKMVGAVSASTRTAAPRAAASAKDEKVAA